MRRHWEKLTLFLRVAGAAPLDNNICERRVKMAIRHRKNSLFYKTPRGARVGDIFMSLIHYVPIMRGESFRLPYRVGTSRGSERSMEPGQLDALELSANAGQCPNDAHGLLIIDRYPPSSPARHSRFFSPAGRTRSMPSGPASPTDMKSSDCLVTWIA